MTANVIRALTPIVLAAIGGAIGFIVLLNSGDKDSVKVTAGMGLAGTAIAAAAGLAQPNKNPNKPEETQES
ncbi:hypothetical protein [Nostoc parmelioides]|uniref:Uncharacterized protein n=1 Tax=Nostoc parmelioides FACHB-3921 TaxID=2692909 RepID=A0ABR8B9Z6_9NOSO|nr:hypothetical protein [Nostoc parmelioides]MBD2250651.1 hypothetical protein [Nostoc parmelioides FACHB-3921]